MTTSYCDLWIAKTFSRRYQIFGKCQSSYKCLTLRAAALKAIFFAICFFTRATDCTFPASNFFCNEIFNLFFTFVKVASFDLIAFSDEVFSNHSVYLFFKEANDEEKTGSHYLIKMTTLKLKRT